MSLYRPFHWPPLQIDRPPRWPFACVVHDDSPRGFFRVPLTQVYPMALPLPPSLSLSCSMMGRARNNLNIFGFVFFILLRWVFLRLALFLILIFYHIVSWNSTSHDFLKMLYKQKSINNLNIVWLSQHTLKINQNFLSLFLKQIFVAVFFFSFLYLLIEIELNKLYYSGVLYLRTL